MHAPSLSCRLTALATALASTLTLIVAGGVGAAYPGTNGKVAYTEYPGIGTVLPDGTGGGALSAPTANRQESSASFSADGATLVFMRIQWDSLGNLDGLNTGIFVMDVSAASTAGATKVPGSEALNLNGQTLSLSPDGTHVALESDGIVVVNVATGTVSRLTSVDPGSGLGADRDPAWSPNGDSIAFSRAVEVGGGSGVAGDLQWHIHVMNADGTNQTSLNAAQLQGTCERAPDWSPDGSRIAFMASASWCEDGLDAPVAVMNADGSGRSLLGTAAGVPVWSPDGTKIAHSPGAGGIHIVGVDGANSTTLRTTGYVDDWQPIPAAAPPAPEDPNGDCTIIGTAERDLLVGRGGNDVICGLEGNDALYGRSGDDTLRGGRQSDAMFGGRGNDTIQASDGARDLVHCGPGNDTVTADRIDIVHRSCENVTRP